MHVQITFKNMDHSPVLEKYAEKQLDKIKKFLAHEPTPIYIEVTLESHEVHQHNRVTVLVKTPNYSAFSEHKGSDIYFEINEALDRMYKQLQKEHRKMVDAQKGGCGSHRACKERFYESLEAPTEEEQIEEEDEIK